MDTPEQNQATDDWGACDINEEFETCEDPSASEHTSIGSGIEFSVAGKEYTVDTTLLVTVAAVIIITTIALVAVLNRNKRK